MKNVLTKHGLRKLNEIHKTPKGEKLRAYELVLDKDSIFDFDLPNLTCTRPKGAKRKGPSAAERNAAKIEEIKNALDLEEKEKGRTIAPGTNVEDLRKEGYLLVKRGKSISIMTRQNYDGVQKYGKLYIGESSYEGAYSGNPSMEKAHSLFLDIKH